MLVNVLSFPDVLFPMLFAIRLFTFLELMPSHTHGIVTDRVFIYTMNDGPQPEVSVFVFFRVQIRKLDAVLFLRVVEDGLRSLRTQGPILRL